MTPTITLTAEQCAVCLCHDVTTAPRLILPTVGKCDNPDAEHPGFACNHISPEAQPVMLCDGCILTARLTAPSVVSESL